ncbi:hypothetical protein [Methanobrevibacter sp.]
MVKFKDFLRFKELFTHLNPINSVGSDKKEGISSNSLTSEKLLEKSIQSYLEFEKVVLIAIYHLINTQNTNKEYLTVLTKDLRLICDLVESNTCSVDIPESLKSEPVENILLTCHNHFYKSIIPSLNDFKNIIKPKIKFTIIVSDDSIGILVNELLDDFYKFNYNQMKEFCNTWKSYNDYIIFCLGMDKPEVILRFYDDCSDMDDEEFQQIFEIFVGENISKFIDEFNVRFKKYNMYCIHIEI